MTETGEPDRPVKDRPWVKRNYAGHSTHEPTNELYRTNLSKGQTLHSDA